jgi:hypothetical protein
METVVHSRSRGREQLPHGEDEHGDAREVKLDRVRHEPEGARKHDTRRLAG